MGDQMAGRLQNTDIMRSALLERLREASADKKRRERVRCPVCQKDHKPLKDGNKPVCKHVSHNAIQLWVKAACPICLEDVVQPPNIALPCGHVVCSDDFLKLGGKLKEGDDLKDSDSDASEVGIGSREEIADALEESGFDTNDVQQMMSLILGGDSNRFLGGQESESGDEEGTNNSLPTLENGSDTDISDSMPALVQRAGEDSDDDSDVPPLIQRDVDDDSSDSDSDIPPLRARGDSSSDESSDNSSIPGLVTRNDSDSDASDSEDDSSLPGLLTRNDSDSDSDDEMPTFSQRQNATSGQNARPLASSSDDGVLLVSANEPTTITRVNAYIETPSQIRDIPRGTRLVPYRNGIILCRPRNRALHVSVHNCTGQTQYIEYHNVSTNSQIVSDGDRGIWTLGSFPNYDGKLLRYFCQRYPTGKSIRRVSTQSILLQGADTATWVHVKQGNQDIDAGLWRFKHDGQRCVVQSNEISTQAKVVPDGHGAIWVVDKIMGSTQIWLATRQGGPRGHHVLDIDIVKESKLISNIEDGVYIHTRHNDQWCLFSYRADTGLTTRITECPKDSKIVTDAEGNAWILQKDRSSSNRILYQARFADGQVNEINSNLPAGTTMIGAI